MASDMKIVYILMVLMIAASTLGCVNQQSPGTSTPTGTSISATETPATAAVTTTPGDDFGAQSDINTIDSVVNDSSMDIALSDATI